MRLYREVVQGIDGHWHDIGKVCRCGVDFTKANLMLVMPVEPDDVMDAAHKLVHPTYDNAADCDKFWCEPFRALKKGIGGDDGNG